MTNPTHEATVLAKNIIGRAPTQSVIDLYSKATETTPKLTANDTLTLRFALRQPWSIGLLDAGLAIVRPHAELRRRLFLLLAILESTPDYYDYFVPKKRSGWYVFIIGLVGLRAILKTIFGIALVRIVQK